MKYALLLAALAACGSNKDEAPKATPPAPETAPAKPAPALAQPGDDVIAATRAVVDDMCACLDRRCVDALEPRWDAVRVLFGSVKDAEGAQMIDTLSRRFSACVINIVTATNTEQ